MALIIPIGSKHTQGNSLGFLRYVRFDTCYVALLSGLITCRSTGISWIPVDTLVRHHLLDDIR